MGHPYKRGAFEIDRFLRFVRQHWGEEDPIPLAEAIQRWCGRRRDRKAVTLANEFGVIRQLCLIRRRRDPTSYVPEHSWAPVKKSIFFPYISARKRSAESLLPPRCITGTHMGLNAAQAYSCALLHWLRLGEAARLKMSDVDLEPSTLTSTAASGARA
ncbi:hypothetical protein NKH45_31350 [Mesorhizobium sp. M1156]|uniref:hypothetical protein n=1 Tax=Mesorhizobium sp. M1156 TaxID=2957064 RepID=UPI00333D4F70